ncbi:MAG: VOC family protein [Nitrospinota bacterium]|nr:VOC family protein [Nitrospinota bacterium]MDH5677553.1 VOC family protein [Nitrospinota bacterium]MDH5757049.1 VOC family protein [Nitrospinota bacterium]
MNPRISMITLGVADLPKSALFYGSGLGLPRLESEAKDVAFFTLNGSWLGLYPKHLLAQDAGVANDGAGFAGVALAHNLADKDQVDALIADAVKAGATLVKPPQNTFWGGYSGYFADPDGYLWEVAWNPHFWVGPKD